MTMTTIGLDLAKYVFQVHGVDAEGNVVEKRRLRRSQVIAYFASIPPCLVGMEACATAHFWGRELARLGHEVRLMPPTSSAERTMPPMRPRYARRLAGHPCALCRSRRKHSRRCS